MQDPNVRMTLNLIDTPGLYERRAVGDSAERSRDNESLLGVIEQCMSYEVTKIHCQYDFSNKQQMHACVAGS